DDNDDDDGGAGSAAGPTSSPASTTSGGSSLVPPASRTAPVWLCRRCGAAHPADRARCDECGRAGALVRLFAVRSKPDRPGKLSSCVSCGATGRSVFGTFREPARPLRAVSVADVHVLAQSMLQHAERRRLLVLGRKS